MESTKYGSIAPRGCAAGELDPRGRMWDARKAGMPVAVPTAAWPSFYGD